MPNQEGLSRLDARETESSNAPENGLRVITCGSADDGKSTLIGCLLSESRPGKRSFIVAGIPGDEQSMRDMVMGAPGASLAIVLSDARKGVTPETRRHTTILSLFGIRHVLLAINKMDLVAWSRTVYDGIVGAYRDYAQRLDLTDVTCIPVSALTGDNVIKPSVAMNWYQGPTLLQALESADVATGRARLGQTVTPAPAGDVDVSRGDVIASTTHPPDRSDQFACHLLWMHENALLPKRPYLLKIGTSMVEVQITALKYKLNVESLERMAAQTLELNDIGYGNISLDRQIAFDPYRKHRETGGFILIDRYTHATVGAGMIDFALRRASNLTRHTFTVDKPARSAQKNQKACVLWFTGLSGAGKSTTANAVEQRLHVIGRHSYVLDGDNLRHGLNKDLGFTQVDRVENVRRIAEVAKLFVDAGLIVVVSVISPFRDEREMARRMMAEGEFIEVFVDAPLEICERRDPKGLYRKARAGEIKNFTGIDSPYEPPGSPDIVLKTAERSVDELADQVIAYLQLGVDPPES